MSLFSLIVASFRTLVLADADNLLLQALLPVQFSGCISPELRCLHTCRRYSVITKIS